MCRNIRVLFHFEPPATEDEIRAAALQYVRKVSGSTKPAKVNQDAFDRAVEGICGITRELVTERLVAHGPPRSREHEAQKAKARGRQREERMRVKFANGP